MFKVGLIRENGMPEAHAFETKDEAENYLLHEMEKETLRQARIRDMKTGDEEKVI